MTDPDSGSLTRRGLLARVPAVGIALAPAVALAAEPSAVATVVPAAFPSMDPAEAREIVGPSHFDFDRVQALVRERPERAKAAYDWGFGDWETALGAASHTGQRRIAELLIEHGARPDLFTAAMLGQLELVRAAIAARPGVQGQLGPHGIHLLAHAEAGGEAAAPVARYLKELGGADVGHADQPLDDSQRAAYEGVYVFGPGRTDAFTVKTDRGRLTIQRTEGVSRILFHQGGHEFHPAGAPGARLRFRIEGGRPAALAFLYAGREVEAIRSS